ncbi:J domain-containing protein [Helicobacter sp. MIT 05-5293]|uniref:J domain-containing protein n=1 Tax=Helicobacter sp. MIT 05-5293 TaxID=1548149 RepID=UPI00051CDA6D|nr:J domain-containing protein [Helicobacter sp. MIT 05-5293]TLD80958.1 J domain-containing protein [Helicobacter sp. MIT 05-5293]
MNVTLTQNYIQITVEEDNEFLKKALAYAEKYFSKSYRLSRTVLILDDGERFKKDYLVNWAYHAFGQDEKHQKIHNLVDSVNPASEESHEGEYTESSDKEDTHQSTEEPLQDLKNLLDFTYLPIRIKIVSKNSLIQRVKIALRLLNSRRVMLKMDQANSVARRYIAHIFEDYYVGCDRDEIYLDCTKPYFWESIMNLISFKVIHNVILDFDYDSFKNRGGLGSFDDSFLTDEERVLRGCYMTLESHYQDDFELVKKRYLKLAKEYHPDNVFGQDEQIVESYNDRFRKIQEAYEKIKHYLRAS